MTAARRDPVTRRSIVARNGLAGLLVVMVAALSALLGAAPSEAARLTTRAAPTATLPALTTAPGSSTGQENRRGLGAVAHRPGAAAGRRVTGSPSAGRRLVDGAGRMRQAAPQPMGNLHAPTSTASGSIDATGPPPSYRVALFRLGNHPLGASHHPAAAGRAPPSSCGS